MVRGVKEQATIVSTSQLSLIGTHLSHIREIAMLCTYTREQNTTYFVLLCIAG